MGRGGHREPQDEAPPPGPKGAQALGDWGLREQTGRTMRTGRSSGRSLGSEPERPAPQSRSTLAPSGSGLGFTGQCGVDTHLPEGRD